MVKLLSKTMSVALLIALCAGNLNAQMSVSSEDYSKSISFRPSNVQSEIKVIKEMSELNLQPLDNTRSNIAYGNKVYPNPQGYISFNVTNIMGSTTMLQTSSVLGSGEYFSGVVYVWGNSNNPGRFYKLNPTTGAIIETINNAAATSCSEMAFDFSTGTMYGYASGVIYTINLTTGERTTVATTSVSTPLVGFAINLDGQAYGVGGDGNFYSINKTNGQCTVIGPTGQTDINYIQSMAFNHHTGVLYWAHSGEENDWLRTINVTTGQATFVSNSYELPGLHFMYDLVVDIDGEVADIINPSTGFYLTNSEQVKVLIKNNGTSSISGFDLSLEFDGDLIATETFSGTIASNGQAEHIFAATLDLSVEGTYEVTVTATITGDEVPANNSKTKMVTHLAPQSFDLFAPPYRFTRVPTSQGLLSNLSAKVENTGATPITNVILSVEHNETLVGTSSPVTIDAGNSAVLNVTTSNSAILIGENTLKYTVSQDSKSENTSTNTFIGTEYVYAVDEGVKWNMGNNAPISLGNIFTINQTTKLFAVELSFAPNTVTAFSISLYAMNGNNPASSPLFTQQATKPATTAWTTYRVPQTVLNPGNYFLCVNQLTDAAIGILADGNEELDANGNYNRVGYLLMGTNFVPLNDGYEGIIGATLVRMHIGNPCGMISNLEVVVQGTDVIMTWDAATGNPINYQVYNGEVLLTTTTNLTYTTTLDGGYHTLGVVAIYDEECISQIVTQTVSIGGCEGVSNFDVELAENCWSATLTWDAPSAKGSRTQMLWDNKNINVGTNGLISSYWTGNNNYVVVADDFDADDAWVIEKIISKGFSNSPAVLPTKFSIVIYNNVAGNKPGTEIYRNNTISVSNGGDPVINLPTAFVLPGPGKYWISIAGVYDATVTPTSGNLASYRWNVYNGPTQVGANYHLHDPSNIFNAGTNWLDASGLVSGTYSMYFQIDGLPNTSYIQTDYNVYRNGEKIAGPIQETTYIDNNIVPGYEYEWAVAVLCSDGNDSEWQRFKPDAPCGGIPDIIISLSANPTNGGLVEGSTVVPYGTSVTINALAAENYNFVNWTKNGVEFSKLATYTFDAVEDLELVANFTMKTYLVRCTAWPLAGGIVSGDGTFPYGTEIALSVTENNGWEFEYWTLNVDGEPPYNSVCDEIEYTFTVTENVDVYAIFKDISSISKNSTDQFTLYPNPVKDVLTVVSNTRSKATVEIFNAIGILVKTIEINGQTEINVSTLPSGIYMIQLNGQTNRFVKK